MIHTSDHGEMLGEHGLWRKSCFYEQAARVPLQMAGPGIPSAGRVSSAVSLVDVVATILDLAGFSEAERNAWRMDGRSLLPLVRGEEAAPADDVFAEYTVHGTDRARAMLRSGRWKLCYDHRDPPGVGRNMWAGTDDASATGDYRRCDAASSCARGRAFPGTGAARRLGDSLCRGAVRPL